MNLFLSLVLVCTSTATALYDSLEDSDEDVSDLYHYLDKVRKPEESISKRIDSAEKIVKTWQSKDRYRPLTEDLNADNTLAQTQLANEKSKPYLREDMMYRKTWESIKYPEKSAPFLVPSVNHGKRKGVISHLQKISSVQSDIVEMLKKIEINNRKVKNCSTKSLEAQQAAIEEMEMSLDMEPDLSLDEPLLSDRTSRSIDTQSLRNQIALAKKKRSKVLQLMEELNQFKDIQLSDMETDSIISAVNTLKHKVCAEVAQEARELAEISKKLQTTVLEKRKHVLKLLADLLLDSNANDEAAANKRDQTVVVKISSSPESEESVKKNTFDNTSLQRLIDSISYAKSEKKDPAPKEHDTQPVKQSAESSNTVSTERGGKQKVSGQVNLERCERCEDLDEEEVCGDNGQTYRTLCHAVNCAGLALKDISVGSCLLKNVCAHSKCSDLQICVPMNHAACLTLYSSDGFMRLPCHRYRCMQESSRCGRNFTQVCGMNGKTYNTACQLYKEREQLAYEGPCRPLMCKGEVCGVDRNTYPSACHAKAHGVRVDYTGNCFSPIKNIPESSSCASIKQQGRCYKEALCHKPVVPLENCCPICGGTMEIALRSHLLSNFVLIHEARNHLFEVVNLVYNLLPDYGKKRCQLSGTLTSSNNISLSLVAHNDGDHLMCQDALLSIANIRNFAKGKAARKAAFEMAPFISLDSWIKGQVLGIQDEILVAGNDFKSEVDQKVGETLLEFDEKVPPLSNRQTVPLTSITKYQFYITLSSMIWLPHYYHY